MWQIDPPLYLGGGGENRNPDLRDCHVEIDVPEQFEVACAGAPVRKDGTVKDQTRAVKESDDLIEKNQLQTMDHCYLNTPWYECPENSDPGNTEYLYTPIFLRHAKEIMGEEAFYSFLQEVYQTYAMKIVHSEDILKD